MKQHHSSNNILIKQTISTARTIEKKNKNVGIVAIKKIKSIVPKKPDSTTPIHDINKPILEMQRYISNRLLDVEMLFLTIRPIIVKLKLRFENASIKMECMSNMTDTKKDVIEFIKFVHSILHEDSTKYTGACRQMQRKLAIVAENTYDLIEEMRQAVLAYNDMLSDNDYSHLRVKRQHVASIDAIEIDKRDRMFKPKEVNLYKAFIRYINNNENPSDEVVANAMDIKNRLPKLLEECIETCKTSLAKLDEITQTVQKNHFECISHLRLFSLRTFIRAKK